MKFLKILTPLVIGTTITLGASAQPAPPTADTTLAPDSAWALEMGQAFRKGDRKTLLQLMPQARGHVLEPWAAYWDLKSRLGEASAQEVDAFLKRYAGSYQEDRLRNDWLLLLGQRRDWDGFAAYHAQYRMSDDREVRCYALLIDQLRGVNTADKSLDKSVAEDVRRNWYALRDADDGCTLVAKRLLSTQKISELDVWRKARLAIEANRPRVARNAVALVAPDAAASVLELASKPSKFLSSKAAPNAQVRQELVVLALLQLASSDLDSAAHALQTQWAAQLNAEERDWLWGALGRQAAQKLSSTALDYFSKVSKGGYLSDDMLAWKTRAALRAGAWKEVTSAIAAMTDAAQSDSTWVYWRARALLATQPTQAQQAEARQLYESIASPRGFYEQLAQNELGQRTVVPPKPAPLTEAEKAAARSNVGLNRGLYAILIGLRSEGTREWNYTTNLHTSGGMGDRELLAAADYACENAVWDRCINTSERTKGEIDMAQRFPMPFHDSVLRRSQEIALDPAYVYGLIRQESRFIMDARSSVGASGLMQVMPATARWTAKKIGLTGFTTDQLHDRETNIAIGTAYLKLALDDFAGSMPLAAAAYNAGPGRPRNWRNGPLLEAAIWAENVPFSETREYVKKVLSNTTNYAAVLSGQPQSLKERLGTVGPRETNAAEVNKDLP